VVIICPTAVPTELIQLTSHQRIGATIILNWIENRNTIGCNCDRATEKMLFR
jgi:hypothetical protein